MMQFITDQQTLEDLNLTGKYKKNSVFTLFNRTQTFGGERALEAIFRAPFAEVAPIQQRANLIDFLRREACEFPIDLDDLSQAQEYYQNDIEISALNSFSQALRRRALQMIGIGKEETAFSRGSWALIRIIEQLHYFLKLLIQADRQHVLKYLKIDSALVEQQDQLLSAVGKYGQDERQSILDMSKMDFMLRGKYHLVVQQSIELVYELDAYLAVASVSNERSFKRALPLATSDDRKITIDNGYHPTMPNAVGNPIHYTAGQNLIFLTGANMAGKSTYMKTFGILMYLAHIGFPVPADRMEFAIREGLFTSINVADDLSMGHSHYFAEVMRVKKVAQRIHDGERLVVIFDELFKGTNVKDAFDATLAITEGFLHHPDCQFMISTHIVEVGEKLKQHDNAIRFSYLPTIMQGHIPTYTYQLHSGISADKHGMILIQKEGILRLLETRYV